MHTWYDVGTSFPAPWSKPGWTEVSCGKPAVRPSVAHLPAGVKQGLCGIIRYVSHALKERLDSHIPRLETGTEYESAEDGYVGQLPRHVAASLGHGGDTPTVGGASADTRLEDQIQNQNEDENKDKPIDKYTTVFAPDPATPAPLDPKTKDDEGVSPAYPTDSKERENERRRRLKEEGRELEVKKKKIPVE